MAMYDVEVEIVVRKTYTVEANSEQEAIETAHESACAASQPGVSESYKEDTGEVRLSSISKSDLDRWERAVGALDEPLSDYLPAPFCGFGQLRDLRLARDFEDFPAGTSFDQVVERFQKDGISPEVLFRVV